MFKPFIAGLLAFFLASGTLDAATCAGGRDVWNKTNPAIKAQIERDLARDPFAEGRFFKVTKGGKTSYLFGTMHTAPAGKLRLPQAVLKSLRAARILMVESTDKQTAAFMDDKERVLRQVITTKPTGFSRYFSKAELQALEKSGLRKSPDVFERIQPWFLYFLSTFQNCEGTPSNRAIMDAKIEQIAQGARIPSLGLEAPATAFAKLQGFSDKDYALMIRAELQARQFINPSDYSKTATEMYIRGEVQKIQVWQFHYYAGGNPRGLSMIKKLWNDRMLRDRNRAWMPTILREFAKGDAFVAVGAMHLGGPHGLMPMLSRKGYVITPIRFVFR